VNRLLPDYVVHKHFRLTSDQRFNAQNMNPRLDAINNLIYVRANRHEIDIILIFIDIVTEDLLALFIYGVHVVDHHHLLLTIYGTMRPTKRLHFIPIVIDATLFQIIDEHYVRVGEWVGLFEPIVLTYDCVQEGRFTGIRTTD
jgi:hypothetical protein